MSEQPLCPTCRTDDEAHRIAHEAFKTWFRSDPDANQWKTPWGFFLAGWQAALAATAPGRAGDMDDGVARYIEERQESIRRGARRSKGRFTAQPGAGQERNDAT